jgi:phosphohistidine phosphatase
VKLLGLLRHAKSDWDDMSLRDFDRGLNNRGRRGAALMGRHIADHGVKWERMLASPAERVKRTVEASGLDIPVTWDERAYLADSETLLALIHSMAADDPRTLLLVAHNPGLQNLIFDLVSPEQNDRLTEAAAEKYPTAAFAVLELDIDNWADCRPGCARLVHFARPRDLDPELGPETIN